MFEFLTILTSCSSQPHTNTVHLSHLLLPTFQFTVFLTNPRDDTGNTMTHIYIPTETHEEDQRGHLQSSG